MDSLTLVWLVSHIMYAAPSTSLSTDYSCAVESKILLHGRMYITDKFICFYSNFFGFEKKVRGGTLRCNPINVNVKCIYLINP